MEIRKADTNDIGLIQQLAHTIWPNAYGNLLSPGQLTYMLELIYSKTSLHNQIEKLQHKFILVHENEALVGFASYSPKEPGDDSIYRLHKLYVLPDQQGKGTGRFLLNYIIEDIKQANAKILELNVKRDNPALHFYNKLGFTITEEVNIDIGQGYFMRDYIMIKRLDL